MFVRGQKDTILVRAIDRFGNVAKGNLLKLDATISGGGYFLTNKDTKLTQATVDGFSAFDLTSNNGGENESIKISLKGTELTTTLAIASVDNARMSIEVDDKDHIIVGKAPHEVRIKVLDKNGKLLDGFSGVASLDFPKNSGVFSTSFVSIKNGVSNEKIFFTPQFVAGENLAMDIQIPGIKSIDGNTISVLPDLPMRVGLAPDQASLEARTDVHTRITAKLFDRYGNLAYNHPAGLKANFFTPESAKQYGRITAENVDFVQGVARSELAVSSTPGTAYFGVRVAPGLESNSFTVSDKSGANLTIHGYSSNISSVDTFYLWNKEKLQKTNYNALYTTLLGADYGNITEPDYLG